MHPPKSCARGRTTSSPAAGSGMSEVRRNDERNEWSCRRSGAAPCCAAVVTFRPPLPRDQSTLRRAETYQPPKTKSCTRAETSRPPKDQNPQKSRDAAPTNKPERRARTDKPQPQKPRREYSYFTPRKLRGERTRVNSATLAPKAELRAKRTNAKLTRRRKRSE